MAVCVWQQYLVSAATILLGFDSRPMRLMPFSADGSLPPSPAKDRGREGS